MDTRKQNTAQTDLELRTLLQNDLPKAGKNPWFTRRVMNRLPEQSRWARLSWSQWLFYILGFAAAVAAAVIAGRWLVNIPFNLFTVMLTGFLSLLVAACAGLLMVPKLLRILREP